MSKHFKLREDERTEFKSSLAERKEILETVSAFSNTHGGTVYIGIDPSGKVLGVDIGGRTLENLANEIKQNTDPKVFPSVETQRIDGKDIIKISVPEFPVKPVWSSDKVFVRVGRSNQRASAEKIRQLVRESLPFQWDHEVSAKTSLAEIDGKRVRAFLRRAEEERNTTFEGPRQIPQLLSRLHLLKKSKPTNAALLMFGKDPQSHFIQAKLRCGRFAGTKPINFIDMKVFEGTIIEQVPEALSFIRKHINVGVKMTGKPEREDVWEYPQDALREAIVNAVCHRDYEDPGNVQIRIFDDRLEVWSPGTLPPGITVESLKREHESKPRNGLIADCFYLIKYIEQWGTGTNRIIDLCKEAGLSVPEFAVKSGSFVVTFKRAKKPFGKEEVSPPIRLNETQKKILDYLRKHDRASTAELRELLGISLRGIQKNIKGMKELVEWSGSTATDPKGKYRLRTGS
jgi:ATP-dependent DNA helicase RecG